MLSRAKHGMYVLGSASTIRGSRGAKLANAVLDRLEATKCIGPTLPLCCTVHGPMLDVHEPDDVSPDGGCKLPCGGRRACGHMCRRACHPDDREHRFNDCRERCGRSVPLCGHPCERVCHEPCGGCKMPAVLKLMCGHSVTVDCEVACLIRSGERAPPKCVAVMRNQRMPHCSHSRDVRCYELTSGNVVCDAMCGTALTLCGHACQKRCSDCRRASPAVHVDGQCEERCERVLMCGHVCGVAGCHDADQCPPCERECAVRCAHSKCSKPCRGPCAACAEECAWRCEHLRCELPCASICDRALCNLRCDKLLACGHLCPIDVQRAVPAFNALRPVRGRQRRRDAWYARFDRRRDYADTVARARPS